MNRETTCLLCGETNRDVKPLLVLWAQRMGGQSEYQVIPRCSKTEECYDRVIAAGDEWIARPPRDLAGVARTRTGDPLPMPMIEVRRGA